MWKYRQTDELYHYGVPGMKWGTRREMSDFNKLKKSAKKLQDSANEAVKVRKYYTVDYGNGPQTLMTSNKKKEERLKKNIKATNKIIDKLTKKYGSNFSWSLGDDAKTGKGYIDLILNGHKERVQ